MGTDDVVFGNNSLGTISLCAKKLGFFATPSDRPREGARDGGSDEREWHVVVVWEHLLSNRRVRQLSLMEERTFE